MRTTGRVPALAVVVGMLMALIGMILSASVQRSEGVSVEQVRFRGESGAMMRALLFRPPTATAARPAPGILAVHGYLNTAEIQANFATEFARRGYVVLAPDQRGHGGSDPAAFLDGFGGPDALTYLRRLPFVDRDNIGLEGHSMGGWAVLAAARAHPNGYRSMVLVGSSVGAPFAPEGTSIFPRNLLVVFGKYDEFGGFMWGPEAPTRTGATAKMRALFGSSAPVEPGRTYGDITAGSARQLLTPPVEHAWLHQSSTGISPAITWFARTLRGGSETIAAADQRWPWREAGNLIALFGVIVVVAAGVALGIVRSGLAHSEGTVVEGIATRPALRLAAMTAIPALLFFPVTMAIEALGTNTVLRQTFTNQFAAWALVCAMGAWFALPSAAAIGRKVSVSRALAASLVPLACAYLLVLIGDRFGIVNPSWWFFTIRPLTVERARDFAIYLPMFLAFTVFTLRALQASYPLAAMPPVRSSVVACAVLAGGVVAILFVQYGTLASTGRLLLADEGLRTILLIGFVPVLTITAILGVISARASGSTLPGALAAGTLIAWIVTAVQPIGA